MLNPHVWGGTEQILVACHMFGVSVHAQTPFGIEIYGAGPTWHLVYATHPVGYYDVYQPPPQEGHTHRSCVAPVRLRLIRDPL